MSFFSTTQVQHGHARSSVAPHLPIDMFQQGRMLVIIAPIAGISIEDISVTVQDEVLLIRGNRKKPETLKDSDYFSQECFWGAFERPVILPVKVGVSNIVALYKRGILRIEIPLSNQ